MTAPRFGILLTTLSLLAACAGPGGLSAIEDGYAPGFDANGEAVDGLIVGRRLMNAGEFELALTSYTRAALQHGMTVDVLAGVGSANLGLGRLGQAEDFLRQAIETGEAEPEVWNNLGVLLVEKGDFPEATQLFKKAYALDNGESDAIRDNLRLALAKTENSVYDARQEQEYKLVRRGGSDYLLSRYP